MDEIKRVGPPVPMAARDAEYELSVALNATPSPAWRRVFQAPDEWKEPCHPSRITVKNRMLVFMSTEARVPMWMEHIDKWIDAANRKRADMTRSTTTPEDGAGDHQRQTLREVTDRLKNL